MSTVADALNFLQGQQIVTASASRGRNAGRAITDTS
jgi:hypothetical protein